MIRRTREDGTFSVLELMITVTIAAVFFAALAPLYFVIRGNSLNDSIQEAVHSTAQKTGLYIIEGGPSPFSFNTIGIAIPLTDGTHVRVTGPANTGAASAAGFEVRGWNTDSADYTSATKAFVYSSATGQFTG